MQELLWLALSGLLTPLVCCMETLQQQLHRVLTAWWLRYGGRRRATTMWR
jgi:hypothetical protein